MPTDRAGKVIQIRAFSHMILYDKCDASCTYVQYSVLVIKVYDIPSVSLYVALALYVHASSACYDTEVRVYTNTTF